VSSVFLGSDCVGRIIDGRFTLLRWLGGTEQSSVFFTELDADPAKQAAIKLTPANAVDAETRIAQWTAATTLFHPHLIRLSHAGRCNVDGVDLLYVVTEYAEEVLSEILRERPLTPAKPGICSARLWTRFPGSTPATSCMVISSPPTLWLPMGN